MSRDTLKLTKHSLTMRLALIKLLVFSSLFTAHAQPPTLARFDGFEIKGAVQRFYIRTQLEPVAIIREVRVYKDYERKAFFRIGVLPVVAMDDVSVEIPNPGLVVDGLTQLQTWLCSHGNHRVELRRLKFQVGSSHTNRIESGRALVGRNGQWELEDGVSFFSGTNQMHAARATLGLAGENAGRLIMNTTPPLTVNLFPSATTTSALPIKRDIQ